MELRIRVVVDAALVLGLAGGVALPLSARAVGPDGAYAEEEMDDCLECHDVDAVDPVLPILATQHGVKADERTPLARTHECQTCHGPSAAHMEDENVPVAIPFGPEYPPAAQNEVCLGCHRGGDRINWDGAVHARSNVSCVDCHSIHVKEDPVAISNRRPDTPIFRNNQSKVCFQCHQDTRAAIQRTSSHPIRDGLINCSDCHNAHGSMGPANLVKPTLNETCYTCHAEKRGPFLWEHAPVSESCANCHTPHGSNHPSLLIARQPQLCQSCHVAGFHPSTAYEGPDYSDPVPGGTPVLDLHVGSRSCLNCHTEVHGSNHPSGARWTR